MNRLPAGVLRAGLALAMAGSIFLAGQEAFAQREPRKAARSKAARKQGMEILVGGEWVPASDVFGEVDESSDERRREATERRRPTAAGRRTCRRVGKRLPPNRWSPR